MQIVFKVATHPNEYAKIFKSREIICSIDFPYLLDYSKPNPAEDQFDNYSFLLYAALGDEVIGSCRATPCRNNLWEISGSLPDGLTLPVDTAACLQLNRVYIDKQYRNINLHAVMFYELASWVLQHTNYTEYFATCNAGLVRFYKRIGSELGYPFPFKLSGRGQHNYYLVKGKINDFKNYNEQLFENYGNTTNGIQRNQLS